MEEFLSAESYREREQGSDNSADDDANVGVWGYTGMSQPETSLESQRASRSTRARRRASKKESSTQPQQSAPSTTRQKGRPRLNPQDQSSAERRRTQIRLAQRTYRQRKEDTISDLTNRVNALEQTIDNMNKTFLEFNDSAIASGIQNWEPNLAEHLRLTLERFLSLARTSASGDVSGGEAPEAPPSIEEEEIPAFQPQQLAPSLSRRQTAPPLFTPSAEAAEALGYIESEDPYPDPQTAAFQARQQQSRREPEGEKSPFTGWKPFDNIQNYRVEIPQPIFNQELPLPISYSSREQTFARRLQRSAYENALRLLANPASDIEDLLRKCRFAFCFSTRQTMMLNMQGLLERAAKDSQQLFSAPRFHIGGSGLHYPRNGIDDGLDKPLWFGQLAPRRQLDAETPVPDSLTLEQVIQLTGCDGEWLDSNDVEQYLRSKGINIDGESNWVEIDESEFLSGSGSPSASSLCSGGPQSPRSPPWGNAEPAIQANEYSFPNPSYNISQFFDPDAFDMKASDSVLSLDPNLSLGGVLTWNTTPKKFLDVEKFVNMLSSQATCLGRNPGYRRAQVDQAVIACTREGA